MTNDAQSAPTASAQDAPPSTLAGVLGLPAFRPRVRGGSPFNLAAGPGGVDAEAPTLEHPSGISERVFAAHAEQLARCQDSVLSGVPLSGALVFDTKKLRWCFWTDDCDAAQPIAGETLNVTIL